MAKRYTILMLFYLLFFGQLRSEITYADFFKSNTLRVDFILAGDFGEENASLAKMVQEPFWGGRKARLDAFHGLGNYKFELKDNLTGKLIYTDGFCTLFEEWQSTQEAFSVHRSFYNSIIMPYPFRNSTLTIFKRVKGEFSDTLLVVPIKPASENIRVATFPTFKTKSIKMSAATENAIDIVFLAEGYQKNEIKKFYSDVKKFSAFLGTSEVFAENLDRINLRAIASFSEHSGCDDPLQNVWVETALNSSFNTIGINRYLMTTDINSVRNIAGMVPYDQVFVLVNTLNYGGGGIFNFINICSAHSKENREVFLHELGHGFGGLGDEYVHEESETIADLNVEPWENNLTLFSGGKIKWENLILDGTPLPTPDHLAEKYKVGLFEGGGNAPEGIYRPSYKCRMRTNEANDFCPVCKQNIQMLIDFNTGN